MQKTAFRTFAFALTSLVLAGCSGGFGGLEFPGSGGASQVAAPATVSIGGRWLLSSPGRSQCHMTFAGDPGGGVEGTIRPEGGCPGKFFTSRKWTYEQGSLVMRDHNGQPLAQLSAAGTNFNGEATTGEPVTLTR